MTIIAIVNQKGGVGKTTSAINLATALHRREQRVLMIDLDPQASLTVYAGFNETELEDREQTLYYALTTDRAMSEFVLGAGPYLLASSIILSNLERELLLEAWNPRGLLQDKLTQLRNYYDFIIIDCPPTLSLLTINGLVAADKALIPVKTDYLSIRGIEGLLDTIKEVQTKANYQLTLLGVLPTLFNPKNVHDNQYLHQLREIMPQCNFFPPIQRSTVFDKSAAEAKSSLESYPNAPGVQNYQKLADIILDHGKIS